MGYFWYGTCRHSAGRPPKWVQNLLQKGAAESHVDPDPQGAAESRVEPDLSGQGTAESCGCVEPAPVPTDESNGDPVEVPVESRSEPGTVTGASDCEPVLVDESMEEPTSFLSDCSLPIGGRSCDQTSAENSPSDEDDTLFDAEDGDEDSREIELEKMMKLCFKCWVCMQTNTNSRYHTTISWKKKKKQTYSLLNLCMGNCHTSKVK